MNKLQPLVRGKRSEGFGHLSQPRGGDEFQGQLTSLLSPPKRLMRGNALGKAGKNDEDVHTSEDTGLLSWTCAILCDPGNVLFHIIMQSVFEEVTFFSFQYKGGFPHPRLNTETLNICLLGHALRLPLLSCLSCWVYPQIQCPFPSGCHCTHKEMLTQFPYTFCKAPKGSLGSTSLQRIKRKS